MIASLVQVESAAAHASSPTIALDYRVDLSDATESLAGVRIAVIDGDRALRLHVDPSAELVVEGLLSEPFIRFSPTGVWVNGRSPTATANRLVEPSTSDYGWRRVTRGHSYTWHDHRLSAPPGLSTGSSARWTIPITLRGRDTSISGTVARVPRPSLWPWITFAVVAATLLTAFARVRPDSRGVAAVLLTMSAALGTLLSACATATAEGIAGPGAWVTVAGAGVLALAAGAIPLITDLSARYWSAAVLACLILAIALSMAAVFAHGVVISSIPANVVRTALATSIVGALAAIPLGVLSGALEEDGQTLPLPARADRPDADAKT